MLILLAVLVAGAIVGVPAWGFEILSVGAVACCFKATVTVRRARRTHTSALWAVRAAAFTVVAALISDMIAAVIMATSKTGPGLPVIILGAAVVLATVAGMAWFIITDSLWDSEAK